MKIKIDKILDWDIVYKVALFTQGKTPTKDYPSEEWKSKTVIAQHSPLRELVFLIEIKDIPNFCINHFVRHKFANFYVRTMREDIIGISNEEINRNTLNSFIFSVNAQELIHISKQRLCFKASQETRFIWGKVVEELEKIEPLLAKMCVPDCIICGYCKEYKSCGYFGTDDKREEYLYFVNRRLD